jgi:TRAP-type C4-dicarboxylate transport system permease small subunit
MQRIGGILIAFGFSVLVYEALRVAVAWWSGEIEALGIEEILVLAALPVIGFVAWRHLRPRRPNRSSPPSLRNPD